MHTSGFMTRSHGITCCSFYSILYKFFFCPILCPNLSRFRYYWILGGGICLIVIMFCLFPLWPKKIRHASGWLSFASVCFMIGQFQFFHCWFLEHLSIGRSDWLGCCEILGLLHSLSPLCPQTQVISFLF